MKKLFSLVSLVLVALMLIVSPTAATFVEDDTYVLPEGLQIYYAENVSGKAPSIDGTIEEGEYGKAYRVETPVAANNWGSNIQEEAPVDPTAVSEYVEVYFAYDEENIYVAIYEMGPKEIEGNDRLVPIRSNYNFCFGFDPYDAGCYYSLNGYATNAQWPVGEFSMYESGSKQTAPIAAYDFITECIVKKTDVKNNVDVGFGDLISANGNVNYADAQCALTVEFKMDKAVVAEAFNQCYFTNYDTISDAMFFAMSTMTYPRKDGNPNQYYKWFGQTDIRNSNGKYVEYGVPESSSRNFMFDLVVFAEEGAPIKIADPDGLLKETEAPETEAPETEAPVTEAPVTEMPTDAPETEANATEPADTEPAKSGCGSSVSIAGLALVAALGTCTAFVAKKKEN